MAGLRDQPVAQQMTATMISAVSSRRVCWFPALLSAFTAAGPVTAADRPAAAWLVAVATAARMARTASRSTLPELAGPVMFAVNCTALPSGDDKAGPATLSVSVSSSGGPVSASRTSSASRRSAIAASGVGPSPTAPFSALIPNEQWFLPHYPPAGRTGPSSC